MTGATVVCEGDLITQAYYIYSIGLRPAAAAKPALSAPTSPGRHGRSEDSPAPIH